MTLPGAASRARVALSTQILVAMALALVVGPFLGRDAAPLGELGKLVVQLIKAAATPLLFFAIVNAIVKTEIRGRAAGRLAFWAMVNASIAIMLGIALSNVLEPGRHLAIVARADAAPYEGKTLDVLGTLKSYVPSNLVTPFAENLVLTIVLLAVLFGFGLRRAIHEQTSAGEHEARAMEGLIATLLRVMELILGWVIKLIPLAVFGVVAKTVGEFGYTPLLGLAWYVGVGVGGLALHSVLTYQLWIALVVRIPLRVFWREAREPLAYAMGANSSLATLPVTLKALDRLGVPRSASALGACVGTNFNNDGIILYEGMAVLFVAQASGIELSVSQQVTAAVICMIAAMGVAGVPEAGFISLALVLNTVHLPVELLPLLLTVDWVIARGRSMTNVLSDMVLSLLIAAGGREGRWGDAINVRSTDA